MNFGNLRGIGFPVEFASPLGGAAWAVLAGIPVGIIALYFLKLRRRPLQVPSTLLWRRSLEDLHVNSLFQRLRKNLLLFLQLLAVLLAMLALAGPRIRGTTGQGKRYVLAIDNSASMSATDVAPNRLARAKAGGEEDRLVDGRRRPGDGHRLLRPGPDRLQLHGQQPPAPPADRRHRPDRRRRPRCARRCRSRRAWPTRRGSTATRRGGRRHVGRHPQAPDLHRRRLPRRRGVQPGQPRARGRRDRPAGPPARPRRPILGPGPESGRGPPRTTSRSSPCRRDAATSRPTLIRSSAASTTTAARPSPPRPSSSATTRPGRAPRARWSTPSP